VDMKLEVAVVPVSDVDRAKRFYQTLGIGWISTTSPVRTSGSCSQPLPSGSLKEPNEP
jgi:hypothetical protein